MWKGAKKIWRLCCSLNYRSMNWLCSRWLISETLLFNWTLVSAALADWDIMEQAGNHFLEELTRLRGQHWEQWTHPPLGVCSHLLFKHSDSICVNASQICPALCCVSICGQSTEANTIGENDNHPNVVSVSWIRSLCNFNQISCTFHRFGDWQSLLYQSVICLCVWVSPDQKANQIFFTNCFRNEGLYSQVMYL